MNKILLMATASVLLGGVHGFGQGAPPVAPALPLASTARAAGNDSVAETLILLQHLLRDVITKRDLEARYAACNRAHSLYKGVALKLTPEQRQTWMGRIGIAFKRLPLPEVVTGVSEVRFHRVAAGNTVVYVSEAITMGQYAFFLSDRRIPVDRIRDQFYETPFLQAGETVTASDRSAPVSGLSYRAAEAYRDWLSTKEGATIELPKLRELPPGLRRSLWVSDRWVEPDQARAEQFRMYGGDPVTLLQSGKPVAEFVEAATPGIQLHLSMSGDSGRRFHLRTSANSEVNK